MDILAIGKWKLGNQPFDDGRTLSRVKVGGCVQASGINLSLSQEENRQGRTRFDRPGVGAEMGWRNEIMQILITTNGWSILSREVGMVRKSFSRISDHVNRVGQGL